MNRIQFIHNISLNVHKDGAYKIMAVGENDCAVNNLEGLVTEVYDSKIQTWRMSGETMAEAKFSLCTGVWINNRCYCILEMPYGVVIFDQKRDLWEELEVKMPAGCNDMSSPCLVECRGRLLMVLWNSTESRNDKFQIWELMKKRGGLKEKGDLEWGLLEEMPNHIKIELIASSRWLICCGVGEWVCIMCQLSPSVVGFNLVIKKWEWLGKTLLFRKVADPLSMPSLFNLFHIVYGDQADKDRLNQIKIRIHCLMPPNGLVASIIVGGWEGRVDMEIRPVKHLGLAKASEPVQEREPVAAEEEERKVAS
ncbi:hypothetical protein SUGI_0040940 [Cryptomeria japonica]|nr:hypothetical protein SUGI_0040940 [Cryptomeria japonica]